MNGMMAPPDLDNKFRVGFVKMCLKFCVTLRMPSRYSSERGITVSLALGENFVPMEIVQSKYKGVFYRLFYLDDVLGWTLF